MENSERANDVDVVHMGLRTALFPFVMSPPTDCNNRRSKEKQNRNVNMLEMMMIMLVASACEIFIFLFLSASQHPHGESSWLDPVLSQSFKSQNQFSLILLCWGKLCWQISGVGSCDPSTRKPLTMIIAILFVFITITFSSCVRCYIRAVLWFFFTTAHL